MKYDKVELEILKTQGRKALEKYRKSKRLPLGRLPNRVIETKKYKQKYKKIDEDS